MEDEMLLLLPFIILGGPQDPVHNLVLRHVLRDAQEGVEHHLDVVRRLLFPPVAAIAPLTLFYIIITLYNHIRIGAQIL